jgi:hypothetical protein
LVGNTPKRGSLRTPPEVRNETAVSGCAERDLWIKSRVSAELKARFRALAAREGRTECGQLKWLLQSAVPAPGERVTAPVTVRAGVRDARLSVRLNADDRRLLRERANARHLPSATYVALLVRAHLLEQPPLPRHELAALLRATAEVAAIGRNLNQYVRAVHGGFKRLLAENTASWRAGERRG